MKPIIKADGVPTICKRELPATKKLRRETDTAANSQDTQNKGKSPKNFNCLCFISRIHVKILCSLCFHYSSAGRNPLYTKSCSLRNLTLTMHSRCCFFEVLVIQCQNSIKDILLRSHSAAMFT